MSGRLLTFCFFILLLSSFAPTEDEINGYWEVFKVKPNSGPSKKLIIKDRRSTVNLRKNEE